MQTKLQRQAVELTQAYLQKAETRFNREALCPPIRFDLRGATAGQVRYRGSTVIEVRYHPVLLEENGEQFLARTVPHEAAHVVVRAVWGNKARAHGREWRSVMRFFGVEDVARCHSYDVSNAGVRRQRRHTYRCQCQEHQLTTVRHNKVQRGKSTYSCAQCRQPLIHVTRPA